MAVMKLKVFQAIWRRRRRAFAPAAFLLFFSAAGCAYKSEIRQGNDALPDKIAELRAGMSKDEVRKLLGENRTPGFFAEDNSWFYYYRRRSPGFFPSTQTWSVELVFDGDALSEIRPSPPPEQ